MPQFPATLLESSSATPFGEPACACSQPAQSFQVLVRGKRQMTLPTQEQLIELRILNDAKAVERSAPLVEAQQKKKRR